MSCVYFLDGLDCPVGLVDLSVLGLDGGTGRVSLMGGLRSGLLGPTVSNISSHPTVCVQVIVLFFIMITHIIL